MDALEAEAISVLREVAATARNPVLLYSAGKDSSTLLRLAQRAFHPAPVPFPVLHVDTGWNFRETLAFRDETVRRLGLRLLVHLNEEGRAAGVTPFSHGTSHFMDVMATQALRQALDAHGFDVAIGGARRDEERSRAKERVFSVRLPGHRWDVRAQRPEPFALYNTRLPAGHTLRVFPLSNWTEADVWRFVLREQVPLVPLYFARPRPVVSRAGQWLVVDDGRFPLAPGEAPQLRSVRFRTLGCYPLTAAVESTADTVEAVLQETLSARHSERQGRLIDHDGAGSMERKKAEGYF